MNQEFVNTKITNYQLYLDQPLPIFPNFAVITSSVTLMIKYPTDVEKYLTV